MSHNAAKRRRRFVESLPSRNADTFPDGRAWVGHGIQPDIKAAPAVADLRGGGDTVLAAALAALKPQLKK